MNQNDLDSPARINDLRNLIARKAALRSFYLDTYRRYRDCIGRAAVPGLNLELGSGGGFVKDLVPDMITSDVLPYDGLDRVVDATKMDFADGSLRFVGLTNVFHHIPDVAAFLGELSRCLAPGGRCLIVDQFPGIVGRPIFKHLHSEPFDDTVREWRFESSGPLSDANGALAWVVFERDQARLREKFPALSVLSKTPHTPLKYWLAGGLKAWTLLPGFTLPLADAFDRTLVRISPRLGSFFDIEIERRH